MARAQPAVGGGGAMTLGEALDTYLRECDAQGYSRVYDGRFHAALARHLAWAVFLRLPATSWAHAVEEEACAQRSPRHANERRRHLQRFAAFIANGPVHYLTYGAALEAFRSGIRAGQGEGAVASRNIDLRVFGRLLARHCPLERIPSGCWQGVCEDAPLERRRIFVRFLRWLQDRKALPVVVLPPPPGPGWRRELAERIHLAPRVLSAETGWQPALGALLRHQRDAQGLSESTLQRTLECVRRFGHWLDQQGLPLLGVDEATALRYLAGEQERGMGIRGIRDVAGCLRSLFALLLQEGVIAQDPLSAVRVKGHTQSALTTPAPAEAVMQALIGAARSRLIAAQALPATTRGPQEELVLRYRDVALLELLCGTGLRRVELARLQVSDLDTRHARLRVRGKGNRHHRLRGRVLDLPGVGLRAALADYLNARQPERDEPLFASRRGGPLGPDAIWKIVTHYRHLAGITTPVSPRAVRHGFASALVARGADPLTLQTVMGHSTPATALQHYVTLSEEELRAVWLRANPLSRLPSHQKGGDGHGTAPVDH